MNLIPADQFWSYTRRRGRTANKYGVAPKPLRIFRGKVYPSRAEKIRAIELWSMQAAGLITDLREQVRFTLGDITLIADFVYRDKGTLVVEDVKGFETPRFKLVRRLWKKYGPCPLHVLKRRSRRWKVEAIPGKAAKDG